VERKARICKSEGEWGLEFRVWREGEKKGGIKRKRLIHQASDWNPAKPKKSNRKGGKTFGTDEEEGEKERSGRRHVG